MSAEVLREASAKMRERAGAATPGPWHLCEGEDFEGDWADYRVSGPGHEPIAGLHEGDYESDPDEPSAVDDAEHIASWHPAVALAVADLLDNEANAMDRADEIDPQWAYNEARRSLLTAVACAYLGRDA